jgi:hypothetical protein
MQHNTISPTPNTAAMRIAVLISIFAIVNAQSTLNKQPIQRVSYILREQHFRRI